MVREKKKGETWRYLLAYFDNNFYTHVRLKKKKKNTDCVSILPIFITRFTIDRENLQYTNTVL